METTGVLKMALRPSALRFLSSGLEVTYNTSSQLVNPFLNIGKYRTNANINTGAKNSQAEVEDLCATTGLPGEALGLVFVFFGLLDIVVSKFKRIKLLAPSKLLQQFLVPCVSSLLTQMA